MKRHHVDALTVGVALTFVFLACIGGIGAGLAWIAQEHGADFALHMVAEVLE